MKQMFLTFFFHFEIKFSKCYNFWLYEFLKITAILSHTFSFTQTINMIAALKDAARGIKFRKLQEHDRKLLGFFVFF